MSTHGSLFAGYGGLDHAIEAVFGARTVWVSDNDEGASKVLAHRYPHAPNLGDVTRIDWATVPRPWILSGGSPCQDLSAAGARRGMRPGTRSGLWESMREGIATLRPQMVVWENVRGALTATAHSETVLPEAQGPALRALGRVLGDLVDLGYDAAWVGLRASDAGAPHQRFRVFVLANIAATDAPMPAGEALGYWNTDRDCWEVPATTLLDETEVFTAAWPTAGVVVRGQAFRQPDWKPTAELRRGLLPTPEAKLATAGPDYARAGRAGSGGDDLITALAKTYGSVSNLLPTPTSRDHKGRNQRNDATCLPGALDQWGKFAPAIARWEAITGRDAPEPLEPATRGGGFRLSRRLPEWMMGLPSGWIVDVPDVTYAEAVRMAGNGVVPQQAATALVVLLARTGWSL